MRLDSLITTDAKCLSQLLIKRIKLGLYNLLVCLNQIFSERGLMLEKDLVELHRHGLVNCLVGSWFEVENAEFLV